MNTLGEHWDILGLLVVNYRYLVPKYYNIVVGRTETSSRLTLGRSATSIYIIYDRCPYTPTIWPELILFTAIVRSEPTWKNVGRPAAGEKENTRAVAVYSFAYYILSMCTHYT